MGSARPQAVKCGKCGYELPSYEARCPECGTQARPEELPLLALQIGARERRTRQRIAAAVVTLVCLASLGLIVLLWFFSPA